MKENPLTKEQVEKISEIVKLSEEEQKKEWPKFLKTLNKEQIEFLKEQQEVQAGKCLFCSIIQGEIPCKKVYEDNEIFAFLDIKPVNKGHTLVIPKKHYVTLLDIPDDLLLKLLIVTKKLASTLMTSLSATGFNININNYSDAGQLIPHLHIHIVPRFLNDGHKLWSGMEYKDEEEFNSVLGSIKNDAKDVKSENVPKIKLKTKNYKKEPRIP